MLQGLTQTLLMQWYVTETNSEYLKKNLQIGLDALHHWCINGNNISECLRVSCLPVG